MRSLVLKLTIAFMFVGLTGAVLVAFFVRQRTQNEFNQLILNQNQQALATELTEYYALHGSWAGVETVFPVEPGNQPIYHNSWPGWEARRAFFTLADANGRVVFGGGAEGGANNSGGILSKSVLNQGVPLQVNGQTVGWLLFVPALSRLRPGTPEGNFLASVNQATIYSALAATAVALLLGGILAFTLTRSLREITAATHLLAKGNLGHQVKVRSRDELGTLAASFNQMSAELAHSNGLRRQMTADIAHDLRTPLSVILGYTEALSDGKFTGSPEMFSVMHTEALHLNHLIDDLKTLSLADAGELPLAPQAVVPAVMLNRTAVAYQVKAAQQEIAIRVNAPDDVPSVEVDVQRMAQVLDNLVSNALRYTPPGGEIRLSASRQNGDVQIQVADTGSGIAPEDLPFVFERSFRGDKAREQQNGETGLGLAIAKSLVEAQGGRIEVDSHPGQGTTFSIRFPVQKQLL
jgi:two-component system sensor histidine kinase BaeS